MTDGRRRRTASALRHIAYTRTLTTLARMFPVEYHALYRQNLRAVVLEEQNGQAGRQGPKVRHIDNGQGICRACQGEYPCAAARRRAENVA